MKRITIMVDDQTYRLSEVKAEERGTTVADMLCEYLKEMTRREADAAELEELFGTIIREGEGLDPSENLSREELHDRQEIRG